MGYPGGLTLEEKVNSLLQSDPLLSMRFFDVHCRRSWLEPEKALMLAVLEDAITCIQKGNRWYRETVEWIVAEDEDRLFSFSSICQPLGLNVASLRLALTDMAERSLTEAGNAKLRRSPQPGRSRSRERIVRVAA